MCGRYSIHVKPTELKQRFRRDFAPYQPYVPHFNAAPSQLLPVVRNDSSDWITQVTWGFIPHWLKSGSKMRPQINARAESIGERPMFRDSFRRRRCLVLADSFYEWNRKGEKVPFRIALKSEEPFAFAGIWDQVTLQGRTRTTFAIITTEANSLMRTIHDRMPVILPPDAEDVWLDPALSPRTAQQLLEPYKADLMYMHEVSRRVNSPKHDDPTVIAPVNSRGNVITK